MTPPTEPTGLREAAQRVHDAWYSSDPNGGWSNEYEFRESLSQLSAALASPGPEPDGLLDAVNDLLYQIEKANVPQYVERSAAAVGEAANAAALSALSPGPEPVADHARQSAAGTHLYDESCALCNPDGFRDGPEQVAGLDVERLNAAAEKTARAMHPQMPKDRGGLTWSVPGGTSAMLDGEALAREYAALSEASEPVKRIGQAEATYRNAVIEVQEASEPADTDADPWRELAIREGDIPCKPRGHRYDRVDSSDVIRCRRCGWERHA